MAAFDASTPPPREPPNFFYTAPKSIEQPAPNLSRAKAIEGATTAIEEGTKGLTKFGEQSAEDVAYAAGQEEQSKFGVAVQAVHDTLLPQDATTDPNVPAPVKQGIDDITMAAAARNQGGTPAHVRETLYLRSLYQTASRLRAQWPGYRDYIDKGIEKATGITPNANAYIKSMLADINEVITKKNSGDQHDRNEIASMIKSGMPVGHLLTAVDKGTMTASQALIEAGKYAYPEYKKRVNEATLSDYSVDDKARERFAKDTIYSYVSPMVHNGIVAFLADKGFTEDKLKDWGEGRIELKPEEVNALGKALDMFKVQLRSQFDTEFNKPGPNGKPSVRISAGDDYNKHMTDAMDNEFKLWHDAIYNPENGRIHDVAQSTKALQDRTVNSVWHTDSNAANFLKSSWIAKEFGGPNLISLTGVLPHPQDITAFAGNALGGSFTPGLESMKATLTAMANHAGGADNVSAADVRAYIRFPLASIQDSSVPDKAKINVFRHVFTGNNNDWLKDIEQDRIRKDGTRTTGKHAVFLDYTNPAFVSAIQKLGEQDHTIVDQYKDWVTSNFTDIFRWDLNNLSKMYGMEQQEGVKFAWVTPKNNKDAPYFETVPLPGIGTAYMSKQFNDQLKFLNEGIKAMHNIYQDATTPELMRQFRDFEFNGTQARINGLLMQGIAATKKPTEGSSKNQEQAPSVSKPRVQSTMNQFNPDAVPVQGAFPRNVNNEHEVKLNQGFDREREALARVPKNWYIKSLEDFVDKVRGKKQ